MNIKQSYTLLTEKLENWQSLPLLMIRLVLAYGFFGPAKMKWTNINNIAGWFKSLDIPLPTISAYLAATTEIMGVVLLALGLLTRFITMPLIITMVVAILTVHLSNGFEAAENGFEIPLYYILMLLTLLFSGAGKISLDYVILKKIKRQRNTI